MHKRNSPVAQMHTLSPVRGSVCVQPPDTCAVCTCAERWSIAPWDRCDDWQNMTLIVAAEGRIQRQYDVAHNGSRFSGSRDFKRLCSEFPHVVTEMAEYLECPR